VLADSNRSRLDGLLGGKEPELPSGTWTSYRHLICYIYITITRWSREGDGRIAINRRAIRTAGQSGETGVCCRCGQWFSPKTILSSAAVCGFISSHLPLPRKNSGLEIGRRDVARVPPPSVFGRARPHFCWRAESRPKTPFFWNSRSRVAISHTRFCASATRVVRAVSCPTGTRLRIGYPAEKIKGCDIGYALAACSREGADSVDACTVTALRCDHCFRSSKFQPFLAVSSVSGRSTSYPVKPITQPTSDRQNFI